MNKAVFFDRDGVINKLVERLDGSETSPWDVSELIFLPNAYPALELTKKLGYFNFIVTNQPAVEEGYMNLYSLARINVKTSAFFGENLHGIRCAIKKGDSEYKPNTGMIDHFIHDYRIDREASFMVGDRWKDIVAGNRSGLKTIFIGEEYTFPYEYREIKPDFICANIYEAAKIVEEND